MKRVMKKNSPNASLRPTKVKTSSSGQTLTVANVFSRTIAVWGWTPWHHLIKSISRNCLGTTTKRLVNSLRRSQSISTRSQRKLSWQENKLSKSSPRPLEQSCKLLPKISNANHNVWNNAWANTVSRTRWAASLAASATFQSSSLLQSTSRSSQRLRSVWSHALSMLRTKCPVEDQMFWLLLIKNLLTKNLPRLRLASSLTPIPSPWSLFLRLNSSSVWGSAAGPKFKYKMRKKKPSDSRRISISFSTSFINKWQRKSRQSTLLTEKLGQEWEEHLAAQVKLSEQSGVQFNEMNKMKLKLQW